MENAKADLLWSVAVKQNSAKSNQANGKMNDSEAFFPVALKLLLDRRRFHCPNDAIAELLRIVGKIGQIEEIKFASIPNICGVCGWFHDVGFNQIILGDAQVVSLKGILPEIVAVVHRAHEKGSLGLSVKDPELIKAYGGYGHPCKAFDDLKHREDYKKLFDTSRRGRISLRNAAGIFSETIRKGNLFGKG